MLGFRVKIANLLSFGRTVRTPSEFEALFRRFRDVLEANTDTLEVITEMGEILGGDYLFDIQYVRRSFAELTAFMEKALQRFDALTGKDNRKLHKRYHEISSEILLVIEESRKRGPSLVTWLQDGSAEQSASLGGKMANLAEVGKISGISVPDGFVFTTRAFERYLLHNRIAERLGKIDLSRELSSHEREDLQELIIHGEFPADLVRELERACRKLQLKQVAGAGIAVRSSAQDEDGVHTFAGQFRTFLNVPPEPKELEKAYKKVLASLFSDDAAGYRRAMGYDPAPGCMAVGFLSMVQAAASGVLFTGDPDGDQEVMIISASPGLGTAVVDGITDSDRFLLSRDERGTVLGEHIGRKDVMALSLDRGGVSQIATNDRQRTAPSITREQIGELARLGRLIEKRFGRPQDIEWAIDSSGKTVILQSRPLLVRNTEPQPAALHAAIDLPRIALSNAGVVVQKGSASGPVYHWKGPVAANEVPQGAIVVMRHDSPSMVRVISRISAVLTDTGGPTSHMASIAREFRLPTIVNTGNATTMLEQGGEVTLVAGDDGAVVYRGRDASVAAGVAAYAGGMDALAEFRKKRLLLRAIAPLNLVDPLHDDFTPGSCRTMHDLLRFMHEKALGHLMDCAGRGSMTAGAVKLELPIPAGLTIIDIGGGLAGGGGRDQVSAEDIRSLPLAALVRGMVYPGLWRSDPVPLSVNDFMTSMLRAPDVVSTQAIPWGTNVAIVTAEYVNLNIKFGYHYTILDSLCDDAARHNHIYFRFAGGATDMTKRSLRLQFLSTVLQERGFSCAVKGDMLIARLAGAGREESKQRLEEIGKLLSYTRQLDAVLRNDTEVTAVAQRFLAEDYDSQGIASVVKV